MIWLHASLVRDLSATETILVPVLVLAGMTSAGLVSLGVVAYFYRQSRSYLLVMLALLTLVVKAGLGSLVLVQSVSMEVHHLFEHLLDVLMAVFLLASIYYARTTTPEVTSLDD